MCINFFVAFVYAMLCSNWGGLIIAVSVIRDFICFLFFCFQLIEKLEFMRMESTMFFMKVTVAS